MTQADRQPTQAELEILQILWQQGPTTVRAVNEILNKTRAVGYTTTLKMMQIMATKGLVQRETSKRAHVYSAQSSQTQTRKRMLSYMVDKVFNGSAGKLVMQVLSDELTSQQELDEIRDMLDKIDGGKK